MSSIRKFLILLMIGFFLLPVLTLAAGEAGNESAVENAERAIKADQNQAATCPDPATATKFIEPGSPLNCNLERLYKNSIPILLWLIIIMIIVGGYVYITSGGNADRVKLAKDILGTTMIGAVLLIMLPLILEALGQTPPTP